MSKVYKRNEIILGQGKLVDININPVIKLNESTKLDKKNIDNQAEELNKNYKTKIEKAKTEAEKTKEKARLKYNEIIKKKKEEEKNIISDAYTKANEILENAKQEGYNEGLATGEEKGFNEIDSLIEEAKTIKENMLAEKESMAKSLEKEIVDLIISSTKKILDYELEKNHSLLLNLVEKGIEKCTYTEKLVIRVNPNDYQVIDSSKNKIYMMTEGIRTIEVVNDPGLEDGSIIIETESGTVNASLKTQIDQIENIFYDILKGE